MNLTHLTCAVSIVGSLMLFSMHSLAAFSHSASLFMPDQINFSKVLAAVEKCRGMFAWQ